MAESLALFSVFGKPIVHSLSPNLHNYAFRVSNRTAFYFPTEVAPSELVLKLEAFRCLGGQGVNLTRPLKESVLPLLIRQSEWVQVSGAANTLVWTKEGWVGENTDCQALYRRLPQASGEPALILGAGGVARATAAVLSRRGYEVWVAARNPRQVVFTQKTLRWEERLTPMSWAVVVNATPLGQLGEGDESQWPRPVAGGLAVDWVYRPRRTTFLDGAEKAGARIIDGLGLLVDQAAISWLSWFGTEGPREAMWEAVQAWS